MRQAPLGANSYGNAPSNFLFFPIFFISPVKLGDENIERTEAVLPTIQTTKPDHAQMSSFPPFQMYAP